MEYETITAYLNVELYLFRFLTRFTNDIQSRMNNVETLKYILDVLYHFQNQQAINSFKIKNQNHDDSKNDEKESKSNNKKEKQQQNTSIAAINKWTAIVTQIMFEFGNPNDIEYLFRHICRIPHISNSIDFAPFLSKYKKLQHTSYNHSRKSYFLGNDENYHDHFLSLLFILCAPSLPPKDEMDEWLEIQAQDTTEIQAIETVEDLKLTENDFLLFLQSFPIDTFIQALFLSLQSLDMKNMALIEKAFAKVKLVCLILRNSLLITKNFSQYSKFVARKLSTIPTIVAQSALTVQRRSKQGNTSNNSNNSNNSHATMGSTNNGDIININGFDDEDSSDSSSSDNDSNDRITTPRITPIIQVRCQREIDWLFLRNWVCLLNHSHKQPAVRSLLSDFDFEIISYEAACQVLKHSIFTSEESALDDSSQTLNGISKHDWYNKLENLKSAREKFGKHLTEPSSLHIILALSKLIEYHNSGDLIKIFICELFYFAFVHPQSRTSMSYHCHTIFANIIELQPQLCSLLLHQCLDHWKFIQQASITTFGKIFEHINNNCRNHGHGNKQQCKYWEPSDDDIDILCSFLKQNFQSVESTLAQTIFNSISYRHLHYQTRYYILNKLASVRYEHLTSNSTIVHYFTGDPANYPPKFWLNLLTSITTANLNKIVCYL